MAPVKIEISDIDAYYSQLEKYLINHFFNFKAFLIPLVFFIISLGLIITGINDNYDIEVTQLKKGQKEITSYDYGISIGIGLGFLVYSFLSFRDKKKSKKASINLLKIQRNKLKKEKSILKFELTDNNISFNSNTSKWTKIWEYYDYFKLENQLLKLFSYSYYADYPELILPLNSLNSEELQNLKTNISNKIKDRSL